MALLDGILQRENPRSPNDKLHPWLYSCPERDCYFAVSGMTEADVTRSAQVHECPYGGEFKMGASVTMTLVETMWEMADAAYVKLQTSDMTEKKRDELRGELKGLCRCLALFGTPHFRTVAEAAEEIRKRYSMRQAGHTEYESPGLGKRKYEFNGLDRSPGARAAKVLTEQEIKTIKFAFDSGMFTIKELAKTYEISEELTREVCH